MKTKEYIEKLQVHTFTPNDVLLIKIDTTKMSFRAMEPVVKRIRELLYKQLGFEITILVTDEHADISVLRKEEAV
jgi:hypothetical protein